MFGYSPSKLQKIFDTTTKLLYERFAKKYLITDNETDDQYWTRERVWQNTTQNSRNLWNLDKDSKLAYCQDSTYQYTKTVQSNHSIFKQAYSRQKHQHLYKPHITTTTNIQVVHVSRLHFSDGKHNDWNIYDCQCCLGYLKWCKLHPNDPKCLYDQEYVKGLIYMKEKILISGKDILINDNGYNSSQSKDIKTPLKLGKKQQNLKPIATAWRRHITNIRNGIERLFRQLKLWAMLGGTKLDANEIPLLYYLWCIAAAWQNKFGKPLLPDGEDKEKFEKRLIELRCVAINKFKKYYKLIKFVKKKKQKKKQKKQQQQQQQQQRQR